MSTPKTLYKETLRPFSKQFKTPLKDLSKRKGIFLKKSVCAVLALVFLSQTALSAAPAVPKPASVLSALHIPETLGSIEKIFTPKADSLSQARVIHIQDAHGYPEAQAHIKGILRALAQQEAMDAVILESVFKTLEPSILNLTDSEAQNRAMAEKLAAYGELTGPELFSLEPESKKTVFLGAENEALYFESYENFKQLKKRKAEIAAQLLPYRRVLDALEAKEISPQLRAYAQKRKAWEKGSDEAFDYLKFLIEQSRELLGEDFHDAAKQFEWPNLTRIAALESMEKTLQRETAQSELEVLRQRFKEKLPASGQREWILEGLEVLQGSSEKAAFESWMAKQDLKPELRTARYFFETLYAQAKKASIQLLGYSQFLASAGLLILKEEISAQSLLKELERLEPRLEKKLIRTAREKQITAAAKDLALIEKLLSLELSRRDYEHYQRLKARLQPVRFQERVALLSKEKELPVFSSDDIKFAENFYRLSRLRDETLLAPVLKQIAAGKSAVLVTGGFHAEGIQAILEEKNIPYLSVMPRMTSIHAENFYEKIMMGEDLQEGYFTDTSTSTGTPMGTSAQHLGAPALLQNYPNTPRFASARARQLAVLKNLLSGLSSEKQRVYEARHPGIFSSQPSAAPAQKRPSAVRSAQNVSLSEIILTVGRGPAFLAEAFQPLLAGKRSEIRQEQVSVQNLSREDKIKAIRDMIARVEKEIAVPGSGNINETAILSDEHGAIEKMDAFVLHHIRRAFPDRIPENFVLNHDQGLEDQLAQFGLTFEDLRGKVFIHNLGDLIHRGSYGIKVARRTMELVEHNLSDFIPGNHDLLLAMDLWGIHLPSYETFNFYGYSDSYDQKDPALEVGRLLRQQHQQNPQTRQKTWWAKKLYQFRMFHDEQQKNRWKPLEKISEQMYLRAAGDTAQSDFMDEDDWIWGQFRGFNPINKVAIYTGTRAVGTVSIVWWEELLSKFKTQYEARKLKAGYSAASESSKAWQEAIDLMEKEIIPVLKQQLDEKLNTEDGWTWRIFEAINLQNYTSPEWYAMDSLYHKGWGDALLAELNEGLTPEAWVTPENYFQNPHSAPILEAISRFYLKNFNLYLRDVFDTTMMHAFLPVDMETGEFHFTYKGIEYRGKGRPGHPSVWEGLDRIAADFADPSKQPQTELYEAISLVMSWYADNTTQAKPRNIARILQKFGAEKLAEINGFSRLATGHIPQFEYNKLSPELKREIQGFLTGRRIANTDQGAGFVYGNRGGYISQGADGFVLWGYEHQDSKEIIRDPKTISNPDSAKGTPGGEILFENEGLSREVYLPQLLSDLKTWLAELEDQDSEQAPTVRQEVRRSEVREKTGRIAQKVAVVGDSARSRLLLTQLIKRGVPVGAWIAETPSVKRLGFFTRDSQHTAIPAEEIQIIGNQATGQVKLKFKSQEEPVLPIEYTPAKLPKNKARLAEILIDVLKKQGVDTLILDEKGMLDEDLFIKEGFRVLIAGETPGEEDAFEAIPVTAEKASLEVGRAFREFADQKGASVDFGQVITVESNDTTLPKTYRIGGAGQLQVNRRDTYNKALQAGLDISESDTTAVPQNIQLGYPITQGMVLSFILSLNKPVQPYEFFTFLRGLAKKDGYFVIPEADAILTTNRVRGEAGLYLMDMPVIETTEDGRSFVQISFVADPLQTEVEWIAQRLQGIDQPRVAAQPIRQYEELPEDVELDGTHELADLGKLEVAESDVRQLMERFKRKTRVEDIKQKLRDNQPIGEDSVTVLFDRTLADFQKVDLMKNADGANVGVIGWAKSGEIFAVSLLSPMRPEDTVLTHKNYYQALRARLSKEKGRTLKVRDVYQPAENLSTLWEVDLSKEKFLLMQVLQSKSRQDKLISNPQTAYKPLDKDQLGLFVNGAGGRIGNQIIRLTSGDAISMQGEVRPLSGKLVPLAMGVSSFTDESGKFVSGAEAFARLVRNQDPATGPYKGEVHHGYEGGHKEDWVELTPEATGKKVRVGIFGNSIFRNPENYPLLSFLLPGIQVEGVEATGVFSDQHGLNKYLSSGAEGATVTGPGKGDFFGNRTFVYNINPGEYNARKRIISMASCTTSCASALNDRLEQIGAEVVAGATLHPSLAKEYRNLFSGLAMTFHSYTGEPYGSDKSYDAEEKTQGRPAAAGGAYMAPTGFAKAGKLVIPDIQATGVGVRGPWVTGSLLVPVLDMPGHWTLEDLKRLGENPDPKSGFRLVSDLTNSNQMQRTFGPLAALHAAVNQDQIRITNITDNWGRPRTIISLAAWYENEWGYSLGVTRFLDEVIRDARVKTPLEDRREEFPARLSATSEEEDNLYSDRQFLNDYSDDELAGMFKGRTVLVRTDYNVVEPRLDENKQLRATIVEDFRVRASVPDIKRLHKAGAKVVLMSHNGRFADVIINRDGYNLKPVAEKLTELIGSPVTFQPSPVGEAVMKHVRGMQEGDIVLLGNLRSDPGEEGGDANYAEQIYSAVKPDAYVFAAFGAAHRGAHASIAPIINIIRQNHPGIPVIGGELVQKELQGIREFLMDEEAGQSGVAILGGAKPGDKIEMMGEMIRNHRFKKIVIVGAMSVYFYLAKGLSVGNSFLEGDAEGVEKSVQAAFDIMRLAQAYGVEIILPKGYRGTLESLDAENQKPLAPGDVKSFSIGDNGGLPAGFFGYSVDEATVQQIAQEIEGAKWIVFNGTAGLVEIPEFRKENDAIIEAIDQQVKKGSRALGLGGDGVAAFSQWARGPYGENYLENLPSGYTLSTGGGASLELTARRILSGLEPLDIKIDAKTAQAKRVIGVYGNLKWRLRTPEGIRKQLEETVREAQKLPNADKTEILVFVPADLAKDPELHKTVAGSPVKIGVQNIRLGQEKNDDITAEDAQAYGYASVLIGHSDRRRRLANETNQVVNARLKAALKAGLKPILLFGEDLNERLAEIEKPETEGESAAKQLRESLADISLEQAREIRFGYEPVWAIGKQAAGSFYANLILEKMRGVLRELYGSAADELILGYGGGANERNIASYLSRPEIGFVLAGRVSADSRAFGQMISQGIGFVPGVKRSEIRQVSDLVSLSIDPNLSLEVDRAAVPVLKASENFRSDVGPRKEDVVLPLPAEYPAESRESIEVVLNNVDRLEQFRKLHNELLAGLLGSEELKSKDVSDAMMRKLGELIDVYESFPGMGVQHRQQAKQKLRFFQDLYLSKQTNLTAFWNEMKHIGREKKTTSLSPYEDVHTINAFINAIHVEIEHKILNLNGSGQNFPILDLYHYRHGRVSPAAQVIPKEVVESAAKKAALEDRTKILLNGLSLWIRYVINVHSAQFYGNFIDPALGGELEVVHFEGNHREGNIYRNQFLMFTLQELGFYVQETTSTKHLGFRAHFGKREGAKSADELKEKMALILRLFSKTSDLDHFMWGLEIGYRPFYSQLGTTQEAGGIFLKNLFNGWFQKIVRSGGRTDLREGDERIATIPMQDYSDTSDESPYSPQQILDPEGVPFQRMKHGTMLTSPDKKVWNGQSPYMDAQERAWGVQAPNLYQLLSQILQEADLPPMPPYDGYRFGQAFIEKYFNQVIREAVENGAVTRDANGQLKKNPDYAPRPEVSLFVEAWKDGRNRTQMIQLGKIFNRYPLGYDFIGRVGRGRVFQSQISIMGAHYRVQLWRSEDESLTAGFVTRAGKILETDEIQNILTMNHLPVDFSLSDEEISEQREAVERQLRQEPVTPTLFGQRIIGAPLLQGTAVGTLTFQKDLRSYGHKIFVGESIEDDNIHLLSSAHGAITLEGNKLDHINMRAASYGKPRVNFWGTEIKKNEQEKTYLELPSVVRRGVNYQGYPIVYFAPDRQFVRLEEGDLVAMDGTTGFIYWMGRDEALRTLFEEMVELEKNDQPDTIVAQKIRSVFERATRSNQLETVQFALRLLLVSGTIFTPTFQKGVRFKDRGTLEQVLHEVLTKIKRSPLAEPVSDYLVNIIEEMGEALRADLKVAKEKIREARRVDQVYYELDHIYNDLERIQNLKRLIRFDGSGDFEEDVQREIYIESQMAFLRIRKEFVSHIQVLVPNFSEEHLDEQGFLFKRIMERIQEFKRLQLWDAELENQFQPIYQLAALAQDAQAKKSKEHALKYAVGLNDLNEEDADLVGNKAANLGWLARFVDWYNQRENETMKVPAGTALTDHAWRHFLNQKIVGEGAVLGDAIHAELSGSLNNAERAVSISDAMHNTGMPDFDGEGLEPFDLLHQIMEPAVIKKQILAVRSSTSIEDRPTASAAGVFQSKLGVTNENQAIKALTETWASLYGEAALTYRSDILGTRASVEDKQGAIFQVLIDADVSGVVTGADISSGNRGLILINAGLGLGEGIVQGEIQDADLFIVNKSTAEIVDQPHIGTKLQKVVLDPSGFTKVIDTTEEERQRTTLTPAQIKRITHFVNELEHWFAYVPDLEFLIKDGEIYWVQVRAIPGFKTSLERKAILDQWLSEVGNKIVRAELRVKPEIEKAYIRFSSFLGAERPYEAFRWVTVNMADGILLPVPAEILPEVMPFLDADLFHPFGAAKTADGASNEAGLHIAVVQTLPEDSLDPLYAGFAQVLNEESNRHVRLAVLESSAETIAAMNLAFKNQYPEVSNRFKIESLNAQGRDLDQGIQRMVNGAMQSLRESGVSAGSVQEFYRRVSFSSQDLKLLNRVLSPVQWKIQDDTVQTPALKAHLTRRGLDLSQELLQAEKIKQLKEIVKSHIISARQDLFSGEDLALVEQLFNQAMAVRQLYTSA